jgi:hypothetical protein
MFKYISNILSQFTPAQRILALLILVFSIIVITLGPSLIGAITLDREELINDLNKKEVKIDFLEKRLDTLSNKIITNQRNCTDMITSREEEFIKMLDKLKSELQKPKDRYENMFDESSTPPMGSGSGSGSGYESASPKPKVIYVPDNSTNDKAIRMIEQMKKQCKSNK